MPKSKNRRKQGESHRLHALRKEVRKRRLANAKREHIKKVKEHFEQQTAERQKSLSEAKIKSKLESLKYKIMEGSRENYEKFINIASSLGTSDDGKETFTFDFEGLVRMIDVAFIEGRMTELCDDPEFESDAEKLAAHEQLSLQLSQALGVENVEETVEEAELVEEETA